MRAFSKWIIALFASPAGVVVLAALDSTLFFSLPFGIDAAVIILSAQLHRLAWVVPVLATAGSIAGAWLTFWMGRVIGEKGLDRYVAPRRLKKVRKKIFEAALAVVYGRRILAWLDSDLFHDIVAFSIVAAGGLTIVSIVKLIRSTRTSGRRSARRAPA
ncbi:MAG: hypothetical protein AUI11_13235 [Acidobacteria bacterium 13_2_20CM_2_66_4]|nr:MAG: hypothetical protein AUI11_13235 [Acidobacteria bacterium 13_2_20CM_2_66_4]